MDDVTRASVTLADVAAHAGVSLATASRALNGSARTVKPDLHARVAASAQTLGYVVNAQAQAVAKGASQTVALVLGDIADPYFAGIAAGVIAAARRRHLTVTMATTGSDAADERATVAALRAQRPRAIVLAGSRQIDRGEENLLDRELADFQARGGRVSFVGEGARAGDPAARVVDVRNRRGGRDVAVALVDLGYRDFVVLAGSPLLLTPSERTAGFLEGAASVGRPVAPDAVLTGPFSRDGGHTMMADLLAGGRRPDCVFAVTDVMAVGAMAAIREYGLRPGADIAVAGFDDIPMLQDVHPELTTVRLPLAAIGERALEIALADDPSGLAEGIVGAVVLRESTPGI
ncbi:LacI family transcriptional regulator [Herbiconiux sp. CPCC 205763]|uniref:LacI family transcriptional regulator n=1 Tax=Herbiconiux aconitum TaxID=2970913 RepID=A0ABT2GR51_9MICO|nr:LacI family DNA-binding transcriptional regulator [Herbiconiux aconitum]MCS5718706.1 LacI family transcriptional regulator [Herbiconiux aconitum]